MADMRFLEADHEAAEFRQTEPKRHLTAQHASLGFRASRASLACDDKNETHAVLACAIEKI